MNNYKPHYEEWNNNKTHTPCISEEEYAYIFDTGYNQAWTNISSPNWSVMNGNYWLENYDKGRCEYCKSISLLSSIPSS